MLLGALRKACVRVFLDPGFAVFRVFDPGFWIGLDRVADVREAGDRRAGAATQRAEGMVSRPPRKLGHAGTGHDIPFCQAL